MIKSKIDFGLIAETKNRLFISWKGIKQVSIKFQMERSNWLGDLMVYTNANSQQSYKETTYILSAITIEVPIKHRNCLCLCKPSGKMKIISQ